MTSGVGNVSKLAGIGSIMLIGSPNLQNTLQCPCDKKITSFFSTDFESVFAKGDSLILHCTSLLRTIFASLAHAYKI